MLNVLAPTKEQGGNLIKFATIFACSSVLFGSPALVNASSNQKNKDDSQLVITARTETKTISNNRVKIFNEINSVLNRQAEIDIKYDEDLSLYFFIIKTSSELFLTDYEALNTLDAILSDYEYMGKNVVVTLEE